VLNGWRCLEVMRQGEMLAESGARGVGEISHCIVTGVPRLLIESLDGSAMFLERAVHIYPIKLPTGEPLQLIANGLRLGAYVI